MKCPAPIGRRRRRRRRRCGQAPVRVVDAGPLAGPCQLARVHHWQGPQGEPADAHSGAAAAVGKQERRSGRSCTAPLTPQGTRGLLPPATTTRRTGPGKAEASGGPTSAASAAGVGGRCVSRVKMPKTVKQILNFYFSGETQLLKQVQRHIINSSIKMCSVCTT